MPDTPAIYGLCGCGCHNDARYHPSPTMPDMPLMERRPYNHPLRRLGRVRRDPYDTIMSLVGDRTVGGRSVPTTWRYEKRPQKNGPTLYAAVENDAFGLVLRHLYDRPGQEPDEGPVYDMNRAEARWLAWFVIRWMAADWFGLRRRIYYWALNRHLDRTRIRRGPHDA